MSRYLPYRLQFAATFAAGPCYACNSEVCQCEADRQAEAAEEAERDYQAYKAEQEARWEKVTVPFAVLAYDSGTWKDDNGVEHFENWPEWFAASFHTTRKGAEVACCYHEDMCPTQPFRIEENYVTDNDELKYKPIREE